MKTYTIADKEEAKKLIGRTVKVVECKIGTRRHIGGLGVLNAVYKTWFDVSLSRDIPGSVECGASAFQLLEKTLDDVEVGDTISKNGYDYRVLAQIDGLVGLSHYSDVQRFGSWTAIVELTIDRYTLKDSTPEEKVEKTVSELEKELGMKPNTLRVKADD